MKKNHTGVGSEHEDNVKRNSDADRHARRTASEGTPEQVGTMVKAKRTAPGDMPEQVGTMVKARRTAAGDAPEQIGTMVKARRTAGGSAEDKPRRSHTEEKLGSKVSPRHKEDL